MGFRLAIPVCVIAYGACSLINSVVVSAPVIQETMGGDTKLPSHIGVPLDPTAARQLALAVSKTWPPVAAASKRDRAKDGR